MPSDVYNGLREAVETALEGKMGYNRIVITIFKIKPNKQFWSSCHKDFN